MIINPKVVFLSLLITANLPKTLVFFITKALKVIVVYKYKNFLLIVF